MFATNVGTKRLRVASTAILLGLASLSLPACGHGDGTPPTPTSAPTSTATTTSPTSTVAAAPPAVLATTRASPVPPVATCPPGSTPNRPGPTDQTRPPMFVQSAAVDRQSGRIVVFAAAQEELGSTWTFDLCTNTWQEMHPDIEPPANWGNLVYDEDSDVVIGYFPGLDRPFWAYDLEANAWTEKGAWAAPMFIGLQLAYDPVSGLVVAREPTNSLMWAYDVDTDQWTKVQQADPPPFGDATVFGFDRTADRLILNPDLALGYTWAFDPRTGTWNKNADQVSPPEMSFGWGPPVMGAGSAFDETNDRLVTASDGVVAGYDPGNHRWEVIQDTPSEPPPHMNCALVYDPINERLVAWGSVDPLALEESERVDDVWAFDPRAREWIPLLARSGTEVWDLVWISDSSGFRTAHAYGARIEADLGVQVEVHDLWGAGLSAHLILEALRGERNVPSFIHGGVPAKPVIRDAEVIVIHGNPLMSDEDPDRRSGSSCPFGPVENLTCTVPPASEREDYTQFEADLAAIYDEIFAIRNGEPVMLRTYDLPMPTAALSTWRSCGDEYTNVCVGHIINFSDAIHRVAADYGVPVASLLRAFHGTDVDQEAPRELFGDGIHPSEAGAAAVADILADLGYEPVSP